MSLFAARNAIYKRLHQSYMRPAGYALRSFRSEQHAPPFHRALVLRSQPWNSAESVDFDLEIVVAHDDYNPYRANGLKVGLGGQDVSLLSWGLAQIHDSSRRYWTLSSDVNLEAVEVQLRVAIENHAIPILRQTETLEGLVSAYAERGPSAGYKPRSWALMKMGDIEAARGVVRAAIENAPHEKARLHAQQWLVNIDA
jgi:hypothetical protein